MSYPDTEYNVPITLRYQGPAHIEAVTLRYQEPGVTLPYLKHIEAKNTPRQNSLDKHSIVGEHFKVQDGPLGTPSGEAEVYLCQDTRNQQLVALKLYYFNAKPDQNVIQQLQGLSHPNIIRLISWGHWQGRFFEVMDYCKGGAMSERLPYSVAQLRKLLPDIINGLSYCHRQGIIHRDIKPNNLFFADEQKSQVQIGDFGISDRLESDEQSIRITRTAGMLTLDYAAPELLDGQKITDKIDYYALGISLIHLINAESPFGGMSNNEILVAHLKNRIPLVDTGDKAFDHLIQGLTLPDAESRWGYEQILRCLKGDYTAPRIKSPTDSKKGFVKFPKATTPELLAKNLDKFNASQALFA